MYVTHISILFTYIFSREQLNKDNRADKQPGELSGHSKQVYGKKSDDYVFTAMIEYSNHTLK